MVLSNYTLATLELGILFTTSISSLVILPSIIIITDLSSSNEKYYSIVNSSASDNVVHIAWKTFNFSDITANTTIYLLSKF